MDSLNLQKCVRVHAGELALTSSEITGYLPQINGWELIEVNNELRLQRQFKFKDFSQALAFTNRVGRAAEAENHHPAILTEWGLVTVTWWTHTIRGLHLNDFIMSAKTSWLFDNEKI